METGKYTRVNEIKPMKYEDGSFLILDQTLLPGIEKFIEIQTIHDVWEAIRRLRVRGAPAIGIAAAYGVYISLRDYPAADPEEIRKEFERVKDYLASARPTAVNLFWALDRMEKRLNKLLSASSCTGCDSGAIVTAAGTTEETESVPDAAAQGTADSDAAVTEHEAVGVFDANTIMKGLLDEAEAIRAEDEESCRAMGEYGLTLLKPQMGILTHCNAGALAAARYGTALAPIYLGQQKGYNFRVFADETRPLLQGARLTAWELINSGVDVTVICDNMAAFVMKSGHIDVVVAGCDRMALNGDGANKIGTLGVAILAKEYGIPFYMFVPTSSIDAKAESGDDIPIEFRGEEEIAEMWYEKRMTPEGAAALNPAFDVTDHKYITAIITEKGIIRPPFEEKLRNLCEARA
jgi:methylthioribose-1-phosphate isomerase